jgi:predicted amidohydrolase YtcJ
MMAAATWAAAMMAAATIKFAPLMINVRKLQVMCKQLLARTVVLLLLPAALLAIIVLFSGGTMNVFAQSKPEADTIIKNAWIWTVDRKQPHAQALAIVDGRIAGVGSDKDVETKWRGNKTQVIDAGGKFLMPGFNDAHVHFISGGLQLDRVQLNDATGKEVFVERVAEAAGKLGKGRWLLGGDWDEQRWSPPELPTKDLIDAVTRDTPVFIERHDEHQGLANSLALKIAGITAETKSPPGGEIIHDSKGNPTGILRDAAMELVTRHIPPLGGTEVEQALRRALQHAASLGVTSVQTVHTDEEALRAFGLFAERGELTTRIYAAPPAEHYQDQAKLGVRHGFGSPYFRLGAIKAFADGSLGSETACFFEPYTDNPKNSGLLSSAMQEPAAMEQRLGNADAAGIQLCVHAIGDRANSLVLDMYERIEARNGQRDRRFRIEHAQHIAAKDFDRFARLHVVASVQPYHLIDDGQWAEKRIGPRIKTTYPFRTFLDKGVKLAFGTDWNVAPLNPMLGLYAAVTRATLDGKNPGGWISGEKLTIEEAIEAYTLGSACAEFQEENKGSITPGKYADLVLLSDNILQINPESLPKVRATMTVVGGKVVFGQVN